MNPKDLAAQTKVPMHLLPEIGPIFGAMACREGAIKYGPYNWRYQPISLMEYIGAIKRHTACVQGGEWIDPLSKVPHFGHIIATAAILLDAHQHTTLKNDIPTQKLIFVENTTVPRSNGDLIRTINEMLAKEAAE